MAAAGADPSTVDSPCVDVCELGLGDVCIGCYRTLDEIGAWCALDAEGKREVIEAAHKRRLQRLAEAAKRS